MWNKITSLLGQYLGSILNLINFQGSAYVNLWSFCLLILSIWVCVKTKSIPVSVSMIFSSIIIAYGAHKVSNNLSGKGKKGEDNDNINGSSN